MIPNGIWPRELAVPLQSIQAELNRLFDEYWRPPGMPDGETVRPKPPTAAKEPTDVDPSVWIPVIDLSESPSELTLVIDLPGVDPSSIDLSLAGNILSLRGEKPAAARKPAANATARWRVKERPTGSFHRQITLVEEVDFDRVEAQAKDGVLTVRLPKRESGQARTITIQPASS